MANMAKNNTHFQVLILCSLGGLLEFFDFMIFALFSNELAQIFFPNQNKINALFATFSTFAIGYLARPMGGIIFGHFGDKYGRKRTFTTSILIMAMSTFLIGFVPSYQSIGIAAPILLIFLRLLQGLSIGGEIPGAITYISEYLPQKKGLAVGMIFCFLLSGISLGLLMQVGLHVFYTQETIIDWAWRLPFFIGGVFGCMAYFLRKKLLETPNFSPFMLQETRFPFIAIFKTQKRTFIFTVLLMSCSGMPLTILFIFLPTYLSSILEKTNLYSAPSMMNAISIVLASLSCLLVGWISDKMNRFYVLAIFAAASLLLPIPIYMIYIDNTQLFPLAILMSSLLVGLALGNSPVILSELFNTNIRYSGIGLAYNIGIGIVGGLTPLLLLSAISTFNSVLIPAYTLMINALVLLVVTFFYHFYQKKQK
ncbi:MFS transporter [uncultured Shewanella sp.]|uniref:MFS transporter n=1 Tax=uncultured Shewanella sp. TaxID=173975 RepID=UPI002634824A|nr:MFS transporter [uncultured Shewanella sp.]